jgi:hypothetical protein
MAGAVDGDAPFDADLTFPVAPEEIGSFVPAAHNANLPVNAIPMSAPPPRASSRPKTFSDRASWAAPEEGIGRVQSRPYEGFSIAGIAWRTA